MPPHMKRREFITLLGGATAAWPVAALAQQGERRIGVIMGLAESDLEAHRRVRAFERALAEHGWVKGRNIRIEYRWAAGNTEHMRSSVKELIELNSDLLVAHTTPVTVAARREAGLLDLPAHGREAGRRIMKGRRGCHRGKSVPPPDDSGNGEGRRREAGRGNHLGRRLRPSLSPCFNKISTAVG